HTANRNIKYLSKEVIPFSEPLDVNSSIHTVYKSNMKSGAEPLNIRIYIQYEDFKEPLAKVESKKQEAES
ncbi:lipase chaperone, partial [Saccharicrinis fermentans]|uniref:lipase chaperone n=2 Tax=Saccharicrinis fermentans TaxID=982 RepID=UPI0005C58203